MIDLVIARLSGSCGLKNVEGALDLESIMSAQFAVPIEKRPSAFVMLVNEQAGDNEIDIGGVAQRVRQTVQIVLCVGAGDTVAKTVAKDAIGAMRNAIVERLLAWAPVPGEGVLVYGGLALVGFKPRTVWFTMNFSRSTGVGATG